MATRRQRKRRISRAGPACPSRRRSVESADVSVKRVRVLVSGDVQGVGFRWYTREQAMTRGLAGFARNRPDGRVEAAFEGNPAKVDDMVEWCRRGPRWATVSSLEVQEENPTGDLGFEIDH
jgi:acylphosphatase